MTQHSRDGEVLGECKALTSLCLTLRVEPRSSEVANLHCPSKRIHVLHCPSLGGQRRVQSKRVCRQSTKSERREANERPEGRRSPGSSDGLTRTADPPKCIVAISVRDFISFCKHATTSPGRSAGLSNTVWRASTSRADSALRSRSSAATGVDACSAASAT